MPDNNQDPQGAARGDGAANVDPNNKQGQGAQPGNGDGSVKKEEQFVLNQQEWDRFLRAAQENARRTIGAEVEKRFTNLEKNLGDSVSKTVAELLAANPDKGKQSGKAKDSDGQDLNSELVKLKNQIGELDKQSKADREKAEAAERKLRESQIRGAAESALRKADCLRPDIAFLVIQQELFQKDDGAVAAKFVDPKYGETTMELDDYVTQVVRERKAPELFRGNNRGGAPASGSNGGTASKVPLSQVFRGNDASEYLANRDKHKTSFETGRVDIPKLQQR